MERERKTLVEILEGKCILLKNVEIAMSDRKQNRIAYLRANGGQMPASIPAATAKPVLRFEQD